MAYRQFEVRGYDKMIERMLQAPLQASKGSGNKELEGRLMMIKDTLQEQVKVNKEYEQAALDMD